MNAEAAYADVVSVYAVFGGDGPAGGGPRCCGGYVGSLLNFEADQK